MSRATRCWDKLTTREANLAWVKGKDAARGISVVSDMSSLSDLLSRAYGRRTCGTSDPIAACCGSRNSGCGWVPRCGKAVACTFGCPDGPVVFRECVRAARLVSIPFLGNAVQ